MKEIGHFQCCQFSFTWNVLSAKAQAMSRPTAALQGSFTQNDRFQMKKFLHDSDSKDRKTTTVGKKSRRRPCRPNASLVTYTHWRLLLRQRHVILDKSDYLAAVILLRDRQIPSAHWSKVLKELFKRIANASLGGSRHGEFEACHLPHLWNQNQRVLRPKTLECLRRRIHMSAGDSSDHPCAAKASSEKDQPDTEAHTNAKIYNRH